MKFNCEVCKKEVDVKSVTCENCMKEKSGLVERIAELEEKQDILLSQRNRAYDQLGWSREVSIYEFLPKDEIQKELEKITQAFGLLTTMFPRMEIDTSDYMGMARKMREEYELLIRQLRRYKRLG